MRLLLLPILLLPILCLALAASLYAETPWFVSPCPGGQCPLPDRAPRLVPVPAGRAAPPAVLSPKLQQAVVRIVNVQPESRSLGSGTLVDKNAQHGLVLTCGHLFREGAGQLSVVFPDGAAYGAKLLAVDQNADLAALLIVAPAAEPATLANHPPQPGDSLISCGYGPDGQWLCSRGQALRYVQTKRAAHSPSLEMSGAARQGDSGGPIVNAREELVAVLWGSDGQVVTGTPCNLVRRFLANLSSRFRSPRSPAALPPAVGDPVRPPAPADNALAEQLGALQSGLRNLEGRLDQESKALHEQLQKLAQSGAELPQLHRRVDAALRLHSADHLQQLARQAAEQLVTDRLPSWTDLVWPLVAGALGLSAPPTVLFIGFKLLRYLARRTRRRAVAQPPSQSPAPQRRSAPSSTLNDDYASQLVEVFRHSGRSPVQDATLGREYDEELRRVEAGSDASRARWARALRDRVESKFHRIHGQSPTPAEPVAASNAER